MTASVQLYVLAICDDADTVGLMERVLARSGDELAVATDLAEGLARSAAEAPDVVFVDVGMGENAGLAIVHHLRAVVPGAVVHALAKPEALEVGTQAMALGGAGLFMLPLSGDELLTSLSAVREQHAGREERKRLEREIATARSSADAAARMAASAELGDRTGAAVQLATLLTEVTGSERVLVYLPAAEGSRQLVQAASHGDNSDAPTFCEEIELMAHAADVDLRIVPLALRSEKVGVVALDLPGVSRDEPVPGSVMLVVAQAATSIALIGEREQSQRGAMKDPHSSAYTFAYFVDVAGREIDKARRHGRRFALATLALDEADGDSRELRSRGTDMAERVLAAVRDTDVLARVDDGEFYLLMPETGGVGAHTCRRRVVRQLGGSGKRGHAFVPDMTMGLATYPHDGTDLSRLLRVAKRRSDVVKDSVVRRLELNQLPLGEVLDTLLWSSESVSSGASFERPYGIELPAMDLVGLAVNCVSEATRSGSAVVVASQHPGMSVGAAVRSTIDEDSEGIAFTAVDVSGAEGLANAELLVVVAEHGTYCLVGRSDRTLIRAVHAADPELVDLLIDRLGEISGTRLLV